MLIFAAEHAHEKAILWKFAAKIFHGPQIGSPYGVASQTEK